MRSYSKKFRALARAQLIEEHQQLEEQLRQSQKMEAIGRLAGGMAHDFNNLLTVITGYSELLLHRYVDRNDAHYKDIEQIFKAGERAAALTRQLLAFSRQQVIQPETLDLNATITNINEMLRRLISEDIDLITILDPTLGHIKADSGQIEQIILNLVVNACDAMPQGGQITISTENIALTEDDITRLPGTVPGDYLCLSVSDTGTGIPKDVQDRIFEPFFTTKEADKGTGLGLAIVYQIVKNHGGAIRFDSEEGKGTTFKIFIPAISEQEFAAAEKQSAPK